VLIKANNKLRVELKYKIYQAVWGLRKELKIEPQKLSQLPAIHWQRRCNIISAFSFNQNLLFPLILKFTTWRIKLKEHHCQ
jgi:hypothetical protein